METSTIMKGKFSKIYTDKYEESNMADKETEAESAIKRPKI